MPVEYVAGKVAAAIAEVESLENLRILCMRAEIANPDLVKRLEGRGAIVDDVACYRTIPETEDTNGAAERFNESGADWITFTSASTVENFHARFIARGLPPLAEASPHINRPGNDQGTRRPRTLPGGAGATPHPAGIGAGGGTRASRPAAASKTGKPKPEA